LSAPVVIGLTGGIGAGKSEALAAFGRQGAATISSDAVAHELLDTEEVRAQLRERWGEDVAPGGRVDRDEVARRVFGKPDDLAWLESVIHPRVGQRLAEWRAGPASDAGVAVVEVPLLFEAEMGGAFDATVAVVADEELRRRRASERGHHGVDERAGRQLSQDEKAARATYVIRNDGTLEDLERQVAELVEQLRG
jgi:dephospho-CoA kinase